MSIPLKVINVLEFTAETGGIIVCAFYFDFIMRHTHVWHDKKALVQVFRYTPYVTVGSFIFISAFLLLSWCMNDQMKDGNITFKQKIYQRYVHILICFEITGLLSLLSLIIYGCFFDHRVASGFQATIDSKNILYLKLMILAIGLLGFFSTVFKTKRCYEMLNQKTQRFINIFQIPLVVIMFLDILSCVGLMTFLGLMCFNIFSMHTLFLVTVAFCGIMATFTIINACIFNTIAGKLCVESINRNELDDAKGLANDLNDLMDNNTKNSCMQFFSYALLGTGMGLMMNHTTYHFAAICLSFTGFMIHLASATVAEKSKYSELCEKTLVSVKICKLFPTLFSTLSGSKGIKRKLEQAEQVLFPKN